VSLLDDKVRRGLRVMFATHAFDADTRKPGSLNTPAHPGHRPAPVAEESMVLLKNAGGALPLNVSNLTSLAVIGDNAFAACHRPLGRRSQDQCTKSRRWKASCNAPEIK